MNTRTRFWISVHRNLLAIISLLLALSGLAYGTWRDETTEQNRNQRAAGFTILNELAALQLVTDHITYGHEDMKGDAIAGWTRVLFIENLSYLVSPELESVAHTLQMQWADNVGALKNDEKANKAVSASITSVRDQTMISLRRLN